MSNSFTDEIGEILRRRKYGVVACGIAARTDPTSTAFEKELEVFGQAIGIEELRDLKEIGRMNAEAVARTILHRDLANSLEIMSLGDADLLAQRLLSRFGAGSHFLTNAEFAFAPDPTTGLMLATMGAFSPATKATFDTGVACVDEGLLGVLWVQDED